MKRGEPRSTSVFTLNKRHLTQYFNKIEERIADRQ